MAAERLGIGLASQERPSAPPPDPAVARRAGRPKARPAAPSWNPRTACHPGSVGREDSLDDRRHSGPDAAGTLKGCDRTDLLDASVHGKLPAASLAHDVRAFGGRGITLRDSSTGLIDALSRDVKAHTGPVRRRLATADSGGVPQARNKLNGVGLGDRRGGPRYQPLPLEGIVEIGGEQDDGLGGRLGRTRSATSGRSVPASAGPAARPRAGQAPAVQGFLAVRRLRRHRQAGRRPR